MAEQQLHHFLVWTVISAGALTFPWLLFKTAPYGRHHRGTAWGPHLSPRLGWVVMEFPTTVVFLAVYVTGNAADELVPLLFLAMWQGHYLNRTFLYPMRLRREGGRKMPVLVAGLGFFFNTINAYINARFISEFGSYDAQWLGDPRFLAGFGIFLAGMALNLHSDNILLRLRGTDRTGYAVPQAGMFHHVSCPNYLGEIVEWAGWALATWSLSGLAFCLFTVANLAPRARSHHLWYRDTFADYPASRKALIPGIF